MPADSNFPNLPPSPIRDDDKFIVNRNNVSHKINASDLLYYLANVDFPVTKPCDDDADCPPGYECFNGSCVLLCNGVDPCPDGYICVDVIGNDGTPLNSYCVQYPFPCNSLPGPDPCPPGYVCYEGFCFKLCDNPNCPEDSCCPEGTICAYFPSIGESVCIPYPFPCDDEQGCPPGYYCWNGSCIQLCGGGIPGVCPPGSDCLIIDNTPEGNPIYGCVPSPFPCGILDNYPDPCPPGYYCFGGLCYLICDLANPCPPGFNCVPVGNENNNNEINGGGDISICMPTPDEGLINDGKLCIIDDDNDLRIIFTANQYGDTFLKFQGIDIDGGNGGGSGTELIFKTLWERVNQTQLDSDIRPTYENVNALPNGPESNIGFMVPGTQWKALYTDSLRNVSTTSDHIATGTTSERPSVEPEGDPIGAGEVRFNTNRGSQVERLDQTHHSQDLEVYNGSTWVRMEPKSEEPLYDDNYEKRLIYGRGLTIETPTSTLSKDSAIQTWASYKTYDPKPIEVKLGHGLRFDSDGAIEQGPSGDSGDNIIVPEQIYVYKEGSMKSQASGANTFLAHNDGSVSGSIPIPENCNHGVLTLQYRVGMAPISGNIPITGTVSRSTDVLYTPPATLEEFRALRSAGTYADHSHVVRLDNPINIGWAQCNIDASLSGRGISLSTIGFDSWLSYSEDKINRIPTGSSGSASGQWSTKSEEFTCSPGAGDINFQIDFYAGIYNATVFYNSFRFILQPYEQQ